ncbi:MAG: hypothetical protein JSW39_04460 [Desulfobacterales bacterium]|nr:MAG: hypothetical protein JSW39_04460 [Desulfobacterales bacterium]
MRSNYGLNNKWSSLSTSYGINGIDALGNAGEGRKESEEMKKFLFLFICALFVAGTAGIAGAAPILTNGDFQNPIDLYGWTTLGDVRVGEASFLSELQGMDDRFALLGLEQSVGPSILYQTFYAPRTNMLTVGFNWAFDFLDLSLFKQDTFASVLTSWGNFDITMLDLATGLISLGLTNNFFHQSFDVTGFGGGLVTIAFSLLEQPGLTFSVAGVDNVSVTAAPVPIPSTILLLASGVVGIVGIRRKLRS